MRAGWPLTVGLLIAGAALALPAAACAYDFQAMERSIATLSSDTQHDWELKGRAGDAIGQNITGMAYKYGIGVPQDHLVSTKWFRMAAQQGEPDAQFNLGRIYESNADGQYRRQRAAPADDAQALMWFRRSAEQGHVPAQVKLAQLLVNGAPGVRRNPVEGSKWLRIALAAGDPTAAGLLRAVSASMKERDRHQGEALASAWLARPGVD